MGRRLIGCMIGLAALYLFLNVGEMISQALRVGEESFRKGMVSANEYDCANAIVHFNAAISANPRDPEYLTERAKCRSYTYYANSAANAANTTVNARANAIAKGPRVVPEVTKLAIADLDAAIAIAPEFTRAYFERALLKGNFAFPGSRSNAEILKDYEKALEPDPENREYLLAKARFLLWDAGDEKSGLAVYDSMLKKNPSDWLVMDNRVSYFFQAKKYDLAIPDLSALVDSGLSETDSRYNRAYAYLMLRRYPEALSDLTILIRESSDEDELFMKAAALEMRAKVYRAMKKITLAQADEKLARALNKRAFEP